MKKNNLTLILIALAIADFLGAVDNMGLNVALPKITETLQIPISISQWIPNAFTLALVVFLIFMGKLGDRIGAKKLYLVGLTAFGIASLLLGFINNINLIIAIRAIQGVATAILYTMPMIIISHLWKERQKAFAVTSASFAGGMLVGPILGGVLTNLDFNNFYGWHLVFLLNVPFVIFGLIVAAKYIPETHLNKTERIDFASVAILAAALIVLTLSFTSISNAFSLVGLALFVALYVYQKYSKAQLFDFHLFQNRTFTAANIFSFFSMISFIGMSFVLTFYLQDILGWNSMQAGLALLPVPIATGIFSAIGGQVKSWRLGSILSGIFILIGLALLTQVNPSSSYFFSVLPGLVMVSAGGGFLMTVVFAAILGSAPIAKSGSASGILNTLQQMGSLIGIALVSSIVLEYKLAFTILLVCCVVGLASAFFVKNKRIDLLSQQVIE